MSFPVLRARQSYVMAEVRIGHGFPAYDQMSVIHSGSVNAGNEWSGNEGDRICVKCTNNPSGTLAGQPAFCTNATSGIQEGEPAVTEF